ncbi:MAG: thioredoxin [Candidatus Sumerlaeaceae bacterium]|nr:thioredoxin [Candidatus Sumerlaeaceae bacterium]
MSEHVAELTDGTFKTEIAAAPAYLVDFWAPWCQPCLRVAPIVEELAKDYDGKLKVGKVNVDDNQQVAADFGISSIPTILIFKGGELKERIVGAYPKNMLKQAIDKHLA